MDIYQAIERIEAFLASYDELAPTETKILPSGDENDTIKIWLNLGDGVADRDVPQKLAAFEQALTSACPEVTQFTLQIRGDAF